MSVVAVALKKLPWMTELMVLAVIGASLLLWRTTPLWTMLVWVLFFFFKQKTAYEITTGDWSSDVCSSDLDGTGDPQIVVNDQGNIGIGTLAPNGSVEIANGGAGDWRGLAVNLRSHMPQAGTPWGAVFTTDATGPDTGAAMWLDCLPI